MLRRFLKINEQAMNLIVYSPSPYLSYFLKTKLREIYNVHKDYVVDVATSAELRNAKLDSLVMPMRGDRWLIGVNAEKFSKKELANALGNNTSYGLTVYWVDKYRTYRQLIDSDVVKKQGVYTPSFSFSRLGYSDIFQLHGDMVGEKKALPHELLDFVANTYAFDPDAVCELFTMQRSGSDFQSKREIIEAVGVGGNSVGSLVVKMLRFGEPTGDRFPTAPDKPKKPRVNKDGTLRKTPTPLTVEEKQEKARKKAFKDTLALLEDLHVTYKYETIKRYMMNTLEAFIEIKQLQILGVYGRINKDIPETYDTKRIQQNRRFERVILEEITLPKLLNLKMCLSAYSDFNAEIALIQAISDFYYSIKAPVSK